MIKQNIKKLISSILIAALFSSMNGLACFAKAPIKKPAKKTVLKVGIKKDVKRTITKRPKKEEFIIPTIEDEAITSLNKTQAKKVEYKNTIIEDDLISALPKTQSTKKYKYKQEILSDEKIVMSDENKKLKRIDYKKTVKTEAGLAVVLKPINKISTKSKRIKYQNENGTDSVNLPYPYVGDRVAFKVVEDVVYNDKKVIEKDTIVYAKIGEVSPRAMGGAPAEMTIEGFEIYDKNGKLIPLDGEIASSGVSLSFWIGLAELATTPFLIGLAVPLLRLLPGGQAVVSPRKNYIVYY